MLSRFYVSNFRSFNKVTEFTMLSGREKRHENQLIEYEDFSLLNKSVIYGANASGKSNLVKALHFSKDIILHGIPEDYDFNNEYFRILPENKGLESMFQYELICGQKMYLYGFDMIISTGEITKEWLCEVINKKPCMIFERNNQDKTFHLKSIIKNKKIKEKYDVYTDDILYDNKSLFLQVISEKDDKVKEALPALSDVTEWFRKLTIIYPDTTIRNLFSLFFRDHYAVSIKNLLEFFDTGINDYQLIDSNLAEIESIMPPKIFEDFHKDLQKSVQEVLQKVKESEDSRSDRPETMSISLNTPKDIFEISFDLPSAFSKSEGFDIDQKMSIKKLVFLHRGSKSARFNFNEESDGTKRLIELLDIIINKDDQRIYVIDELDRSLHPKLTKKFIEAFDMFAKNKKKQLIVTTHESSLMDQSLLRRDSIWFVERTAHSESELLSLDAFKERYDKKIEKAYLEGRYGAIPVFREISFLCDEKDGDRLCP